MKTTLPVLSFCGTFHSDEAEIGQYVPYDYYEKLWYALNDLMDEIDALEGVTHSRDFEPYKAEAVWDDVIRRAQDALKAKP